MISCTFCDHKNAVWATRCASCVAELPAPDEPTVAAAGETPLEREVLAAYRTQGIISAIKIYRERTGSGLKDAKDAVEALARRYNVPRGRSGGGCAGSLAVVLAVAGAMLAGLLLLS